jgi:hypothetical protein
MYSYILNSESDRREGLTGETNKIASYKVHLIYDLICRLIQCVGSYTWVTFLGNKTLVTSIKISLARFRRVETF